MAVREIRLYGDPVLFTECAEIVNLDKAKGLITDLVDTTKIPGRAGVAAPQIGVSLRAFSYNVDGEVGYLINPRIIQTFGEKSPHQEGCLSLPGLWHDTPRFEEVIAEGLTLDGEVVRVHGKGLLAQALQHECDHLDGKLYVDQLSANERKIAMKKIRETDWFLNR